MLGREAIVDARDGEAGLLGEKREEGVLEIRCAERPAAAVQVQVDTARRVRRTDSTTVGRSSGDSERRSTTSRSRPSSSAAVAASRQVRTIGPYAISVASVPSRTTRACHSGSGVSEVSTSAFSQ